MASPVVHFEIMGKDGEKLKDFYKNVFEWNIDSDNPMNYGLVKPEGNGIGGGISQTPEGMAPMATFYIEVENCNAHLKKIEEMGGKIVVPTKVIPNMVTYAMFQDPEGNLVGIVQARQ